MASVANRKTEWFCRKCEVTVTLYVRPRADPTHVCRKQLNKTIPLTKKEEQ
jgi:hypothetical protein